MSDRLTLADIAQRCDNVNRRLAGSGRYVAAQGRNGYIGLDEYAHRLEIAGAVHNDQLVRTITVGTKREVGDFLHAMMVGIDLSRSEDWRVQGI